MKPTTPAVSVRGIIAAALVVRDSFQVASAMKVGESVAVSVISALFTIHWPSSTTTFLTS
jgi:hypothetical protein